MYGRARPSIGLCNCGDYGVSRTPALHEKDCEYVRACDYQDAAAEDAADDAREERRLWREREDAWERGLETTKKVDL